MKYKGKKEKYSLTRNHIVGIFLVGIVLGYIASIGFSEREVDIADSSTPPENVDLSEFWKVWGILENKFIPPNEVGLDEEGSVGIPSSNERVWGAIQGLTRSYEDPYTTFLTPSADERFRDDVIDGRFDGIGIYIETFENYIVIVSPLNGTPAERAGIRGKDIILEIDGESTYGITTREAANRIRGEKGTEVELTIGRERQNPFKVMIVRDRISIPSVETEIHSSDTFIIHLRNFSAPSILEFRNSLKEFVLSGRKNLVIDIRNNHGGLLDASIEIASFFLPYKDIILHQSVGTDAWRKHESRGYDIFNRIDATPKIALLVNEGSASSSEILAGALKHHGVATLVGTTTFGKGSVQELVRVTDSTSLKLTISHWRDASGEFITDNGVTPHLEIENDPDTEEDEVLEAAVSHLRGEK